MQQQQNKKQIEKKSCQKKCRIWNKKFEMFEKLSKKLDDKNILKSVKVPKKNQNAAKFKQKKERITGKMSDLRNRSKCRIFEN